MELSWLLLYLRILFTKTGLENKTQPDWAYFIQAG